LVQRDNSAVFKEKTNVRFSFGSLAQKQAKVKPVLLKPSSGVKKVQSTITPLNSAATVNGQKPTSKVIR
jgi:hypothetical protein